MTEKFTLLKEIDDVLIFKFRNLNNFKEIADMLEISPEFLHSILYQKKSYETFFIQKKSGGSREIKSPNNNLKIIQKKLAYILSLNYKMHKSSFGFIKNKSIIDNAKQHTNKTWVFNFDLKDYFHQFNQ
ncbi:RNA-dependent DNA polymerase, partial [Listeria monocytogenes]|nr:RNA-dependent DNA polymerase [Listeria monocytogenes]